MSYNNAKLTKVYLIKLLHMYTSELVWNWNLKYISDKIISKLNKFMKHKYYETKSFIFNSPLIINEIVFMRAFLDSVLIILHISYQKF